MHARITSIEWPAGEKVEGMDEVIHVVRDQLVPSTKQFQGFKGLLGLSQEGRIILLTLWETEADPQVSAARSYLVWLKDQLSFLPNLSRNPLWLRDDEIFSMELPCT